MSTDCSIFLSRLLDDIGYSCDMVKIRQALYASLDLQLDPMIQCGSKREGLSLPFENDYDRMCVVQSLECRDVFNDNIRNDDKIKFQLERFRNTAPGYTLLKCISPNSMHMYERVRECLVEVEHGKYFLSSDSWKIREKEDMRNCVTTRGLIGLQIVHSRDNQGPSCPSSVMSGLLRFDHVSAIQCHSPQLLSFWARRPRHYGWPSSEIVAKVMSLEAHVVPIGYKDSPLQFLEWRICFTKAEICLIESLNDCQTKLIILLKWIAKHQLKPLCKEISTYVIKNLVLWMAEKYPTKEFVEHRLLALLMHALKLLKRSIMNKNLRSYMVEERNLFADRISDKQRRNICIKIDILLHEGPKMLLRCSKILDGLNLFRFSPYQFYIFSKKRRCLESIILHYRNLSSQFCGQQADSESCVTFDQLIATLFSQDSLRQISIRLVRILYTDLLGAIAKGENLVDTFAERLKYYLA